MTKSHRIDVGPFGPLIQVGLNVGMLQAQSGRGGPPLTRNALIDTGANCTAISESVRRRLRPMVAASTSYQRPGVPAALVPIYSIRLNFEGHLSGNP